MTAPPDDRPGPPQPVAPAGDSSEPSAPVTLAWLWLFALAWLGFWLMVMLPSQVMLAQLARAIDPDRKVRLASVFQGTMLVAIVLAVPLVGFLCDRTRLAWGRRRAWALGGFTLASLAFALVGQLDSVPVVCGLLVLVALGQACVLVGLSAMIADQVPVNQRGRASAAFGAPQVIALAGGMALVTEVIHDVSTAWWVIALLAAVCCLPFLLGVGEPAPPPGTGPTGGLLRNLTPPRPRRAPDYYWAMSTRVLVNAGNLVGTAYLLYYVDDVLHRPDPEGAALTLTLVYLVFCVVATYAAGLISDRKPRRKPLVLAGAAFQIAAALSLAVSPTWEAAVLAAALLGVGYGTFLSVDQVLTIAVLPDVRTRARDLGLVNAAQNLPIAPFVGFTVLTLTNENYRALYVASALIVLLGAWSVTRIRSVS
ncbi:MFS transporter [Streptomyces sp. DT24]|uniref:MFS transporter n=1 Tax=unclassified Streptomyces TaxID=2593676 RepID=UPI0023B91008|nr:MFS transporter [Streptomyces sp. AM 4-1-1]WEH36327.1 MFS transporter [Streptomyces sp. AM 4-1-1]